MSSDNTTFLSLPLQLGLVSELLVEIIEWSSQEISLTGTYSGGVAVCLLLFLILLGMCHEGWSSSSHGMTLRVVE